MFIIYYWNIFIIFLNPHIKANGNPTPKNAYNKSKRILLPTPGVKSQRIAPHNLCLAMLKYKV